MQQRKQADHLASGDRFAVTISFTAEVISHDPGTNASQLLIRPVPCGPACGEDCECAYSMLAVAGSYPLRLSARQRVLFLGNLSDLLAESERIRAQIERLQKVEVEQRAAS